MSSLKSSDFSSSGELKEGLTDILINTF
jgi:hypothetical protein